MPKKTDTGKAGSGPGAKKAGPAKKKGAIGKKSAKVEPGTGKVVGKAEPGTGKTVAKTHLRKPPIRNCIKAAGNPSVSNFAVLCAQDTAKAQIMKYVQAATTSLANSGRKTYTDKDAIYAIHEVDGRVVVASPRPQTVQGGK